uniref:Cytosolic carboxypeptidase 1-like n=1 Tax=Petromyzon marinus TaxID=7757 RepID=A0AAJ7SKR2_PETMA|nr:cytosolic carboxypeptidase 1-like [Petromyzon marinus]
MERTRGTLPTTTRRREGGGAEEGVTLGGIPPRSHRYPDLNVYARFCPDLTHDFVEYVRDAADDDGGPDDDDAGGVGEELKPETSASSGDAAAGGPAPWPPTSEWAVGPEAACRHARAARLTRGVASPAPGHRGATAPTAFPDAHGHSPAPAPTRQLPRREHVQRDYVLEDIARIVHPDTLLNRVVFDIESTTPPSAQEAVGTGTPPLTFYSAFESGNLRKAIQVRSYEYDLLLNSDPNSDRHHQWFYFEVGNVEAGTAYRLNIINCEKSSSQFNHGMQPVLYSVREALEGRPYWVRAGTDVCYYKNSYRRPSRVTGGVRGKSYYSLVLTLTFPHSGDVCYLAHHYPYTYTSLMVDLESMLSACDRSSVFVQRDMLCLTAGGNSCPILTITAAPTSQRDLQSLRRRPCVLLSARVHPGESNSSWVMRGSLGFLLGPSVEARALRLAYVFRVLPMLNPDGVASGAHRCALSGEDLNRQWRSPCPERAPTVYHSKGLLLYLASVGHTPAVFCDYHGHSSKKNVFLYGCSLRETLWYSELGANCVSEDSSYRTLARLLATSAPMFSERSSRFLVERSRDATARVVAWRELGVRRSYTMETTYCGCDHGPYKGLQLGLRELQEMGECFCIALLRLRPRLGHGGDNAWTPGDSALRAVVGVDEEVEEEEEEAPCDEEPDYSACSDSSGPDDFLDDLLLSDPEPDFDPATTPHHDPSEVAALAIRPGVVTYDSGDL